MACADEETQEDYDELVEVFGTDAAQLATMYLRRHRLFKMQRSLLDLGADDFYVFLIIEEEMSRWQAQRQADLQDQNKRLQNEHPTHH